MGSYIRYWILGVVLAQPTKDTATNESANSGENSDQVEEDSSQSSSEDDDFTKKSRDKENAKLNTHVETSNTDYSYSSFAPTYEHRNNEIRCPNEYGIPGPPNKFQHFASPTNLVSNVTSHSESISSTSLDHAPSELDSVRGERRDTVNSGNMSSETLSADNLTMDARACATPRVRPKGAKTIAEKLGKAKDTESSIKIDEKHEYSQGKEHDTESLNDFIKHLVQRQISPQANVKFYDAAIVYEKEDYEGAMYFKEETMMIVKSELNQELRIELFDSQEFAQSKVCVVEDVLNKCSLVFVYLTANFKSPELKFFIEEAIGMSRLGLGNKDIYAGTLKNDRQWILKPIHTMPPKFRAYRVPVGLLSLNGIEWYNRDSLHTRDQIRAVMHKAINTRKQREMQTYTIQYHQMRGSNPNVQEMYARGNHGPQRPVTPNVQPEKHVQFSSHQSHDAMSLYEESTRFQHTHHDPLTSGRTVIPPNGGLNPHQQLTEPSQMYPTNIYVHTNRQDQRQDHLQQGFSQGMRKDPIYQEQRSSLPGTMYGNGEDNSQLHTSYSAYQFPQAGYAHQSAGMQNYRMQPDIRNSFQEFANQPRSQMYRAPFVRQSAGLQNYGLQHEIRDGFQGFTNQPRSQMYPSNVPLQRSNVYTNQPNTYMRPMTQTSFPGQSSNFQTSWRPQNMGQPQDNFRLHAYPRQQNHLNMSQLNGGYAVDMPGVLPTSPVSYHNGNFQQAELFSHNADQPLTRDALHSEPGNYVPDQRNATSASSQVNVVSKVTGKLIINPNLSTDDVEIDNYVSTKDAGREINAKSRKQKGKRVKKRRNRSKYESEESNSDSDFDIPTLKSKADKKVVNIVGCKVVQLGSRNKVKELERKYVDGMEESQTINSKCTERHRKESVEEIEHSSNTSSSHASLTQQNKRLTSNTGGDELSVDDLSLRSSLRRNVNNSSEEKHFPQKKNVSESLFRSSDGPEVNRLSSTTLRGDISGNDVNVKEDSCSFENNVSIEDGKCPSSTDDNEPNEDYLFKSGAYSMGTSTCDKESVVPFGYSQQFKCRVMDVFVGRKCHSRQNNQYTKQEKGDSEID